KKAWLTCAYTHLQAGVFTPEFAMSASGTKQPQKGFQWTAMSEQQTSVTVMATAAGQDPILLRITSIQASSHCQK
ncbi:hypothetical protein ACNSO7_15550, partial [Yersinia enterocolitica]|uniref:hypothetical protein n=1 Tax=Yersinia enterocolitica TaxID=630 RepID=UPI003AB4FB46